MSSEWREIAFGEFVALQRGHDLPDQDRRPGPVPILGSFGITGFHDTVKANGPGVTIGRSGASFGVAAYTDKDYWPLNTALYVTDFKGSDPKFVFYFFKEFDFSGYNSGSAQPSLNRNNLYGIPIRVPQLSVQKQIASFVSALDDRITLLRETNTTLEAIAQALFKSWFVDFDPVRAKQEGRPPEGMDEATAALFPDEFEESELGLVPKGWRVVPFLEACDLQGGAQPPASTFVDTPRDGYVRLLQIRDFSTDAHKTYIPDTSKLKKATEDDVLLGRYGSASGNKEKDSLGRVCRGLSGAYNVALMKLVPMQIGREFALQLVNDPRFYNYLQGVSSKAVQSGFSKSELGQYKVLVPSKPLIEVFERIGAPYWDRLKNGVERQRELADLRDTLLPRLISGQLRLPAAEAMLDEAAT